MSDLKSLDAPRILVKPPGPRVQELLKLAGVPPSQYLTPIAEEAEGVFIRDPDGNIFIDFISGRCVVNVGHRHPRIVEAIKKQLNKATHGFTEDRFRLERELARVTPGRFPKRVSYSLSGSDANDGAIKLARWSTKRPYIIAFAGAYHGVTYGALSVSSYLPRMVRGFGPNVPGIYHFPYPYCYRCPFGLHHPECDLRCARYIEDYAFRSYLPPDEVAAAIIEPIAGDAGWIVPPEGYIKYLKEICQRHGILLIDEEVQTGFGRTGRWFAIEHWGVEPDIVVLGKAMAGGIPLSAVVGREELFQRDGQPFAHGYTFGGYPLACAAALENIRVIEEERLVENAGRVGAKIEKRLMEIKENHSLIGDVRGKGLLLGAEVVKGKGSKEPGVEEASAICAEAFQRGLYIIHMGSYGTATLRVAPPLIITERQAEAALNILEEAIKEVEKSRV